MAENWKEQLKEYLDKEKARVGAKSYNEYLRKAKGFQLTSKYLNNKQLRLLAKEKGAVFRAVDRSHFYKTFDPFIARLFEAIRGKQQSRRHKIVEDVFGYFNVKKSEKPAQEKPQEKPEEKPQPEEVSVKEPTPEQPTEDSPNEEESGKSKEKPQPQA